MEINEIKSQLNIKMVLQHYLLTSDRNNRLHCPWHPDKTPSLQIYPKTNTWTCFSTNCNAGSGDTIEMIQRMEKCSKHQAIMKAKAMLNGHTTIPSTTSKQKAMTNPSQDLNSIFAKLRQSLHRSKNALTYLKERNLDATKLELGYNHYQTDFKHLRNCIIFPLKNKKGEIVSLYGRSITGQGDNAHYYLKNRKGLYPGYPGEETKTLVVTEAIVDAASLLSHTEHEVLSLFGTNGWNEEHTEVIRSLTKLEEVIFFFDGDEAGRMAIEKYAPLVKAMKVGISISKVETPEGEDVNSLVQSHEPGILEHLVNERIFIFLPAGKAGSTESALQRTEQVEQQPQTSRLDVSNPEYIKWHRHNLLFTVIGGVGLYPLDRMNITLGIKRKDSNHPLHSLRQRIDLYQDDLVEKLARKVAERLEIGSRKIHESLLELTELLEKHRAQQNEKRKKKEVKKRELTTGRIQKAQSFLAAPKLHDRTNALIGKSGMIGEEKNRMILKYVFTSRLREKPLHVMCLGASGTGKTYLQERIGALIPEDHKKEITAMSDNAVYYFEEEELVNKLLLIEDLDGANEQKVLYALRELMSKTKVNKTIVIKDSKGTLRTISLEVRGPICLAGTTTKERLYEDNSNRSLLLYLDNSKAQRERIMDYQRRKSAGLIDRYGQDEAIEFMKDIQSVLEPILVVNPYATDLKIPEEVFKPLRTNDHYIQFIETVTFYHQYQRERKYDQRGKPYIETTIEDIEIANELLKDVLLAKSDELTKTTRRFYETIRAYVGHEQKDSFYSGEIRQAYRMTPSMVKRHLRTLVRYGYVKISGGSKSKGYEYEINEEVTDLKSSVYTALDEVLNKVKRGKKDNGTENQ